MDAVGRLGWIQVDCADPVRLATFWSRLLGTRIDRPALGDPPHYVGLVPAGPGQPLGGDRYPAEDFSEYGFRWRVMVDPEGNEFCLVRSPQRAG